MKKQLCFWAAALLLAAGAASCSKEQTEKPVTPVTATHAVRLNGGNVLVNLPAADYDVAIPAEAAPWIGINEAESAGTALVLTVSRNDTGAERQAVVTVTRKGGSTLLATVTIRQSNVAVRTGEFVIEEIYFTGTALPETGSPDKYLGDQYIRIRNNTDETLYADGMLLILASALNSGQNAGMVDGGDFRTECCAGTAFYCIPGGGRDVPVESGKSLIIVNNAQNHLESNPASWNATTADFEWYDISSNDAFQDTDNPAVPNLDKWYAQTQTVHTLHNRGFNAVAIAMPPAGMTAERFLTEYPLTDAYYIFHSPNGSDYTLPLRNAYRVPNDWVLDAVNTGCRDAYYIAPWDASLDAGYAWCGTTDGDPERFGKAAIRKSTSDGRLVDTNNSSNDFDSNVRASLLAKQ